MKLDQDPRLPMQGSPGYERTLYARLYELFRNIALVSNNNADGVTALNEIAQAAQDAIAALGSDIESLNTALNSKANASHTHSTSQITNIVGSVANGSIIERGSNANGEYVKLMDGTMICTCVSVAMPAANIATGGGYQSQGTGAVVFPIAFIAAPYVAYPTGYIGGGTRGWATQSSVTTSQIQLVSHSFGLNSEIFVRAFAIGRWK